MSDGARFEAKRVGAHLRNRAENGERLSPHMLVKMPPQIGDDEKHGMRSRGKHGKPLQQPQVAHKRAEHLDGSGKHGVSGDSAGG